MTEPKPKILLVSSEFPPNVGGIGNHAYNLAKALSDVGYIVSVITNAEGISLQEVKNFAARQAFYIQYVQRSRIVISTYVKRIFNSLRSARQVEVIICSGKFSLWLAPLLHFFYPKKKLIAIVHGSELDLPSAYARRMTNRSLQKFDKIISVSQYTQNHLPKDLSKKIGQYIIPNGIDTSEFLAFNKTDNMLSGDPSLITVGSVTERKGQENVIRALPAIKNAFPNINYHVVGKPVLREKLEQVGRDVKVEDRIHFYGAVSRKELLEKLSSAKIKLMLSNHTSDGDFEGFGIAVLEANAFGIPVVGSRNSGIADAIQHGITGVLVNPKDAKEVASAVEEIERDYERYSVNALAHAKRYDWKNIVQQYINVLND